MKYPRDNKMSTSFREHGFFLHQGCDVTTTNDTTPFVKKIIHCFISLIKKSQF